MTSLPPDCWNAKGVRDHRSFSSFLELLETVVLLAGFDNPVGDVHRMDWLVYWNGKRSGSSKHGQTPICAPEASSSSAIRAGTRTRSSSCSPGFLANHIGQIMAADFFVVPTA